MNQITKFASTSLACVSVALVACSGAPNGPATEGAGTSTEADSITLTQLIVNADGTTTQRAESVPQAKWKAILAAKEAATAAAAEGRVLEKVESLRAETPPCSGDDLWLYYHANGWFNSTPPDLCLAGTGNWEADPPGCSWLCFGFGAFWAGQYAGAFSWRADRACDPEQNFSKYGFPTNLWAPNPVWVSVQGTCSVP